MGRGVLQDLCPTVELAAADFAAECIALGRVRDAIDMELGYNGKRTDPVSGFVVGLAKVLFCIKDNKREEAVAPKVSILQSGAFDAEVSRSYIKKQRTVTNSVSRERRSTS